MSEAIVAKRYAEALFQLGKEKTSLERSVEELRVVRDVFKSNQQLYTFLKHPRVSFSKKKQFIQEVFQDVSKNIVSTIKLLVERHRIDRIEAIIDHFIQMVNEEKGIAEATVYSVRELSDAEQQELGSRFAKRYNKKAIQLNNIVDPSLIGGLRIRMGNTIYDGSVSGKLKRIERNVLKANN